MEKKKDARFELRMEESLKERAMAHAKERGESLATLISKLLKKTINTNQVA